MSTEKQIKEWHEWRRAGLGSSDAPVIMGHYEYNTPFKLWEEKTSKLEVKDKGSYITNKGNEYEPIARAKYELETGLVMPAGRFEHHEFNFLRATMDGYNSSLKQGIEIKYIGKDVFDSGKIPEKHKAQMQHQFIVTGARQIDYVAFWVEPKKQASTGKIKITKCYPDHSYIMDYLKKAILFWEMVKSETPPDLVDKDVRKIKGHDDLALRYIEAKKILDQATKDVECLKERLTEITADVVKAEFGKTGLTVIKGYRSGNIDYSKIEALKEIDLEQYRKKPSSFYRIILGA